MRSSILLKELASTVRSIIQTTENSFSGLSEHEMNWKENATRWSMLECFEHLNRYSRFYHAQFEKVIASSLPQSSDVDAASTWLGKKFINMMHPKNTKKQKTLKHMDPLNSSLGLGVLEEFMAHQKNLLAILEQASRVDLNKAKVSVEFLRLLKMNLGDALQFVIVHEQRHLQQAQGVLSKLRPHSEGILKV